MAQCPTLDFGAVRSVQDPTETLSDRLGPVAFDGDDGLLRRQRQRSAAANETERRTNRHVLKPGDALGVITDTAPTICSAVAFCGSPTLG